MIIKLTDRQLERLKEKAKELGVSAEELISAEVGSVLSFPDSEFEKVMKDLLVKNKELYRRLAK